MSDANLETDEFAAPASPSGTSTAARRRASWVDGWTAWCKWASEEDAPDDAHKKAWLAGWRAAAAGGAWAQFETLSVGELLAVPAPLGEAVNESGGGNRPVPAEAEGMAEKYDEDTTMDAKVTVVVFPIDAAPHAKEIGKTLEDLRRAMGGDDQAPYIEAIRLDRIEPRWFAGEGSSQPSGLYLYVDENGLAKSLPRNPHFHVNTIDPHDGGPVGFPLVGVCVVGKVDDEGESCSLSDEEIAWWAKRLVTATAYEISWTDSEGHENEASGSLSELHAALVESGYSGPSLAVSDEAGFVRGWVGGSNGWHAA